MVKRGKYDMLLNELGISPVVIAKSESGIVHEFIAGENMKEENIHDSNKYLKGLAKL